MTKNELKVLKMNILGGMATYVDRLELNCTETIVWNRMMYPYNEETLEIIANDPDDWAHVCGLFARIVDKEN